MDGYECMRNKFVVFFFYFKEYFSFYVDFIFYMFEMFYLVLIKENFIRDDVVKMFGYIESLKVEILRKVKDVV